MKNVALASIVGLQSVGADVDRILDGTEETAACVAACEVGADDDDLAILDSVEGDWEDNGGDDEVGAADIGIGSPRGGKSKIERTPFSFTIAANSTVPQTVTPLRGMRLGLLRFIALRDNRHVSISELGVGGFQELNGGANMLVKGLEGAGLPLSGRKVKANQPINFNLTNISAVSRTVYGYFVGRSSS